MEEKKAVAQNGNNQRFWLGFLAGVVIISLIGMIILTSVLIFREKGQVSGEVAKKTPETNEAVSWTEFSSKLSSEMTEGILNAESSEIKGAENSQLLEFVGFPEYPDSLIVFYALGCGYCEQFLPILSQAQKDFPEIDFYALNIQDNREIAQKFQLQGTPSSVINGKYFLSGYVPKEFLYSILEEF